MDIIAKKFRDNTSPMGEVKVETKCNYSNINLGIGDLDINTDIEIIEKTYEDMKKGCTHYTNPFGEEELRRAIVRFHRENFENYDFDWKNVLITTGACHGLYLLFKSIIDEGDEIILIAPYFPVYKSQIELVGGKVKIVNSKFENSFQLIRQDIEEQITPKTKAIVINSPCNPCGVCYNIESLEIIKEISKKYDLLVIADEVYDFFDYDNKFIPMITLEGMRERTISICSFSKDYAMTGWRIGYAISEVPRLLEVMSLINESIVYSAPSISQRAGYHAIGNYKNIREKILDIFRKRREYVYERIEKIPYMKCVKNDGGIYFFVNIENSKMKSVEFSKFVYQELNINVIPGVAFGMEGFIRIAFTVELDILKEAFDRLEKLKF